LSDPDVVDILRETVVIEQRLKDVVSRHGSNVVLDDMQKLVSFVYMLSEKIPDQIAEKDEIIS
jgi:hypothetical protein